MRRIFKRMPTELSVHSDILVDINTHIDVLGEPPDILRKLSRRGVQKSLVIPKIHPLI